MDNFNEFKNYISNIRLIDPDTISTFKSKVRDRFNELRFKFSTVQVLQQTDSTSQFSSNVESAFNELKVRFANAQEFGLKATSSFKSKLKHSLRDKRIEENLRMQYNDNDLFLLNVGAMVAFGLDKLFAMNDQWRIRELNLLLCCLNAPLSSLLSMFLFRHKIRHPHFYILSLIGLYMMFNNGDFILSSYWKVLGLFNFGFIAFSLIVHF